MKAFKQNRSQQSNAPSDSYHHFVAKREKNKPQNHQHIPPQSRAQKPKLLGSYDLLPTSNSGSSSVVEAPHPYIHERSDNVKTVIIMRHGKVDFSYHTWSIYAVVHKLLNKLRKLADNNNRIRESFAYKMLSKLLKLVKNKLEQYSKSNTDYGNLNYQQFMSFLSHVIDPPLAETDNDIDTKELPEELDVIYHSSSERSLQTANYIRQHYLNRRVQPRIEQTLASKLDEVRFSETIISKKEFIKNGGLTGCRKILLGRWYNGVNKAETFENSISRAEELLDFIKNSPDKNILLITHGWYLRLLFIYFNGINNSLENLESKRCIFKHGGFFKVELDNSFSPHNSFHINNLDRNQL